MEALRDANGASEGSFTIEDLVISYSKYTSSADSFAVGYKLSPVDGKPESMKLKVGNLDNRRK